jgi:hypothetical protein
MFAAHFFACLELTIRVAGDPADSLQGPITVSFYQGWVKVQEFAVS